MIYAATTGVIIYWKPDQPFVIHRAHHVLFDEYNYRLYIEEKHSPGYLLLSKYFEGYIHESDLLNFITREHDLTPTPFIDKTIITYDIDLPLSGNKLGFNLL